MFKKKKFKLSPELQVLAQRYKEMQAEGKAIVAEIKATVEKLKIHTTAYEHHKKKFWALAEEETGMIGEPMRLSKDYKSVELRDEK